MRRKSISPTMLSVRMLPIPVQERQPAKCPNSHIPRMRCSLKFEPNHHARQTKLSIPWKGLKRLWPLGCVILLTGCTRVNNYFIVRAPSGDIASAELQLCGKNLLLVQNGSKFLARMAISCEGSGKITVRLKDGSQTSCPIGYLTHGIEATFEYVIKDGACV